LKLNLANILTLFRIAAIPIVVICFYSPIPDARPIAAVIFGVAALTDLVDGWVARRFKQQSRFGEFLDPVADKLMVVIVLVMLVQTQSNLWEDIIAMIIIGREITISALREWMATIGERANVRVHLSGKIKTTLQMLGITCMVWELPVLGIDIYRVGYGMLIVAAVMTIYSMVVYLKAAWPSMSREIDPG
jgi:CDP-diacylglycerol--glycerol-3-phosphate 3-phosphatidyltransferase